MKVHSLESKSSPIWAILFLAIVFGTFRWDSYLMESRRDYSLVFDESRRLARENKFPEALKLALDLQEKFPNHPYYLRHLAEIYFRMGNREQQIKVLAQLIDVSPAIVAQETCPMQVPKNNLVLLKKCVERLPDDPDSLLFLARAEIEVAALSSAKSHLNHALELAPRYADVHIALGKLAEKEGSRTDALVHFRDALALRPGDQDVLELLKQYPSEGVP